MLNLQKNTLHQIKKIITDYKDVEKNSYFRFKGKWHIKKTSDIDIAIFSKNWSSTDINLIRDILDENLKTPLKIDVINFYALNKKKLKTNILHQGKIIYECRKNKRNF